MRNMIILGTTAFIDFILDEKIDPGTEQNK